MLPVRRVTALGLVSAALLASGCATDEASSSDEVACQSGSECSSGRICDFNHCITPGSNQLSAAARLIPPPATGLLEQHVPALDLSGGPDLLISLLEPTIVRGVVVPSGDAFTVNVEGDIEVETSGDIEGVDYRFTARSREGVDEQGHGYELRLLPGRRYRGTFRADAPDIPPFGFVLEPEEIADGAYDIVLPSEFDYVRLAGRLRKSDYTPVANARIVALLPDNSVGGVVTTEPQRGQFELVLAPGTTEVRLKVQAPPDGVVFPDFTTEALSPSTDIDVTVPDLPTGTDAFDATIHVVGADESGVVSDLGGYTVTIVGDLALGTIRRTGQTDADGLVRLSALPGAYECLVVSPPGSHLANWLGKITLLNPRDDGEEARIQLTGRVGLYGVISDADGVRVQGGSVIAERRVDYVDGQTLVIAPQPYKGDIDINGRYELLVDAGVYDIRVNPDPMTGAPPLALDEIPVFGGSPTDFTVPEPGLAHLTVADPSGAFLPDVKVELYQLGGRSGPRLLTKATTGEAGFVDILVPFVGQ